MRRFLFKKTHFLVIILELRYPQQALIRKRVQIALINGPSQPKCKDMRTNGYCSAVLEPVGEEVPFRKDPLFGEYYIVWRPTTSTNNEKKGKKSSN